MPPVRRDRSLPGAARLTSDIPAAKGLKSSSAVGVAVGRAVCRALHVHPTDPSLAIASAEVAQSIGLSATGAFDDAMASAGGGVAVTDNPTRQVRLHEDLPAEWSVLVWPGTGTHLPSVTWRDRFRAAAAPAAAAVFAAERREWVTALETNSHLVESVVGYDFREVREKLRSRGAVGSGVSGLGPAFATIVPRDRLEEIRRAHPAGADAVLSMAFVPRANRETVPP